MNLEQLAEVEAGLGITLPEAYRQGVRALPGPLAGKSASKLWDDPRALIALNLELRRTHGWPARYFALGRDPGGSAAAIDLELALVFSAERCRLPRAGEDGYQPGSISEFFDQCLRDLAEAGKPAPQQLQLYDAPRKLSSERIATAAIAGGVVAIAALGLLLRACH